MRGRLINPAVVEIVRIDTAGAVYDDTYDEMPSHTEPDGAVVKDRAELPPIRLRAQVAMTDDDRAQITGTSLEVARSMMLTFHFREFEKKGLVDPVTGKPALNKGDRITAFYDTRGKLLETVVYPPGLYATHLKGQNIGIGRTRNLLQIVFSSRGTGAPL